jgi:hypothetical protein
MERDTVALQTVALQTGAETIPGWDELEEPGISDEELTALALAADPDEPPDPGAVPFSVYPAAGLLPVSYMPPVTARGGPKWRASIALLVVVALLVIEAFGLCITYGVLTAA